jgi:tetratricopeptide (TPR) repeat protein
MTADGKVCLLLTEGIAIEELVKQLEKASALLELGRHTEAAALYRKYLLEDPDNGDVFACLSSVLIQTGELAEAESHAIDAIHLDPLSGYPHYVLGLVRLEQGRDEDAYRKFKEVVELEPESLNYLKTLVTAAFMTGREDVAREVAERCLCLDPEDPTVALLLCLNSEPEKTAQRLPMIDGLLEQYPESSLLHVARGKVQRDMKQSSQAQESFRRALELEPESDSARWYYELTRGDSHDV